MLSFNFLKTKATKEAIDAYRISRRFKKICL